jgi:hypothetical protein
LEAQAIKNPYFKQVVYQTKQLVYGYWDKDLAFRYSKFYQGNW